MFFLFIINNSQDIYIYRIFVLRCLRKEKMGKKIREREKRKKKKQLNKKLYVGCELLRLTGMTCAIRSRKKKHDDE